VRIYELTGKEGRVGEERREVGEERRENRRG